MIFYICKLLKSWNTFLYFSYIFLVVFVFFQLIFNICKNKFSLTAMPIQRVLILNIYFVLVQLKRYGYKGRLKAIRIKLIIAIILQWKKRESIFSSGTNQGIIREFHFWIFVATLKITVLTEIRIYCPKWLHLWFLTRHSSRHF